MAATMMSARSRQAAAAALLDDSLGQERALAAAARGWDGFYKTLSVSRAPKRDTSGRPRSSADAEHYFFVCLTPLCGGYARL